MRYSIEKGGFKRMPGGVVHEAWLSPRLADPQIEESGWLVNGLHGGPSEDDIDRSPPPWSLRDEVADLREHRP